MDGGLYRKEKNHGGSPTVVSFVPVPAGSDFIGAITRKPGILPRTFREFREVGDFEHTRFNQYRLASPLPASNGKVGPQFAFSRIM